MKFSPWYESPLGGVLPGAVATVVGGAVAVTGEGAVVVGTGADVDVVGGTVVVDATDVGGEVEAIVEVVTSLLAELGFELGANAPIVMRSTKAAAVQNHQRVKKGLDAGGSVAGSPITPVPIASRCYRCRRYSHRHQQHPTLHGQNCGSTHRAHNSCRHW
jgi:hypothetical protein